MKKKLAIIGTGISGMGCAHYLKDTYEITIFEKNDYLGGHTHTHLLQDEGKSFSVDTGFIVFNNETYPNLLELLADIGVNKQESDMSFSVWNRQIDLQYGGSNLLQLFAQKRNLFSPQYRKFLWEITTFFKVARNDRKLLIDSEESIEDYCHRHGLSKYFIDNYLVPMSAAVRSTGHTDMYNFPIGLLLPFFQNHGLLGVNDQFQRYTVEGGSDSYTKKIASLGNFSIHLQEPVLEVVEHSSGVEVRTDKQTYTFDAVIMATHADTSLNLVKTLSPSQKGLLSAFTYNKNIAVLHTDESIMPPIKSIWASWTQLTNTTPEGAHQASTVYRINKLQRLPVQKNYFVSINPFQQIKQEHIIKELPYDHPLFTTENFRLQKKLQELNTAGKIYFCGSYFGNGFHEDGLVSALSVVKALAK